MLQPSPLLHYTAVMCRNTVVEVAAHFCLIGRQQVWRVFSAINWRKGKIRQSSLQYEARCCSIVQAERHLQLTNDAD